MSVFQKVGMLAELLGTLLEFLLDGKVDIEWADYLVAKRVF